jgi:hypothetical protein
MDRFAHYLAAFGLLVTIGCGSNAPVAEKTAEQVAAQQIPSPENVVSQFLDEVRRGGDAANANNLLTVRARQELKRIGQSIQPIGSPDARFTVTRAELVPGEENSALVHSVWSEPGENGTSSDFQVVWAVEKESAGWRISGLAMELEQGKDPIIIDFENAELMANLLAPPAQQAAAPSQAAAPDPAVSR